MQCGKEDGGCLGMEYKAMAQQMDAGRGWHVEHSCYRNTFLVFIHRRTTNCYVLLVGGNAG